MLNNHSYEMTRALVAERQQTARHEARHRLGILGRRARRHNASLGNLGDLHNPPPSGSAPRETLFG
jgi:hypothetical protein